MSHEIAKLLLEHAGSFLQRSEAVKTALSLGMPLHEIESYLDWLDSMCGQTSRTNGRIKAEDESDKANGSK